MNIEQAKKILSTATLLEPQQFDSEQQLAYEQLRQDASLKTWFDHQQETDRQIQSTLQQTEPPADLLDSLLNPPVAKPERNILPFPIHAFAPYAIAACLVLAVIGISFKDTILNNQFFGYHRGISSFDREADFQRAMADFVYNTQISLDELSDNRSYILEWLTQNDAPTFGGIPQSLADLTTLGCKKFFWQDMSVSLVCFHTDNGKLVHLFTLHHPGQTVEKTQVIHLQRYFDLPTGGWHAGDKSHILVGSEPDVDIEPMMTHIRKSKFI